MCNGLDDLPKLTTGVCIYEITKCPFASSEQ